MQEELRELLRAVIREELSAKARKAKAEFVQFGVFSTGENTQLRISVAENENGVPSVGLAKAHGQYVEKTFGFRLNREVAEGLMQLITKYYPDLLTSRKKGRGA